MSFVGTRPEAVKYVEKYKPEYMATLLLPAGITSEASIRYKDEAELLDGAVDVDKVYVEEVLPGKMKWNLESIRKFSFIHDIDALKYNLPLMPYYLSMILLNHSDRLMIQKIDGYEDAALQYGI